MLLIDGLLLMLMNEWLLVKCRLLHILLTVTMTQRGAVLLLLMMMEIFHTITLATRQPLLSTRAQHQRLHVVVNVLKM